MLLVKKEKASQDAIVNERWLFSVIKYFYFRHPKAWLQVTCFLSSDTVSSDTCLTQECAILN